MKINKLALKSAIRGLVIGVGWVIAAVNTYLASGNSFGFNAATFLGVGIQLALILLGLAQRYLDTTDPAFGRTASEAVALVIGRLSALQKSQEQKDSI